MSRVIRATALIGVVVEDVEVGAEPPGGVAVEDAVLVTAPASMSACVIR